MGSLIPDYIVHNNISTNTPVDIVNSFFPECLNRADASNFPITHYNVTSSVSNPSCSSDEIQSLIRKLKNNSAAGIDGITNQILKHTASSISPILCNIFILSLTTGRISPLRQTVAKNHPPSNPSLPEGQWNSNISSIRGFFLPKSSTSDAFATALHDWYGCLKDRKSVVMALFDLSKAFDRVPQSPLLLKLGAVDVSGPLHSWLKSYLSN